MSHSRRAQEKRSKRDRMKKSQRDTLTRQRNGDAGPVWERLRYQVQKRPRVAPKSAVERDQELFAMLKKRDAAPDPIPGVPGVREAFAPVMAKETPAAADVVNAIMDAHPTPQPRDLPREEPVTTPPICPLCKYPLTIEDARNRNTKFVQFNGDRVLVHKDCPDTVILREGSPGSGRYA